MPGTAAYKRRVNRYGKPAVEYAGYEDGAAVRDLDGIAVDIPRKKTRGAKKRAAASGAAVLSRWYVAFLAVCCHCTCQVPARQIRSSVSTVIDFIERFTAKTDLLVCVFHLYFRASRFRCAVYRLLRFALCRDSRDFTIGQFNLVRS